MTLKKACLFCLLACFLAYPGCKNNDPGPKPKLTSFAPISGPVNSTVILSGIHFSSSNKVQFNGVEAKVLTAHEDRLIVSVPDGATSGKITVSNKGQSSTSEYDFTVTDAPLKTSHSFIINENDRVATVILTELEFARWNDPASLDVIEPVTEDVYKLFNDEFDFIFLIYNNDYVPVNYRSIAGWCMTVSNNATGIGQQVFNSATNYGSEGKLKSIINIPSISEGPFLHEIMHTWGNYSLPTETFDTDQQIGASAGPHWGYAGCGGALGGFTQAKLKTNIDGNPNKYRAGYAPYRTFSTVANTGPYSNFELYLMGMIGPDELTTFDIFQNITSYDGVTDTFIAETRITYDRQKIESDLGIRTPSVADSQKDFKMLALVVSTVPLSVEKNKLVDDYIAKLVATEDDGDPNSISFYDATFGKGTLTAKGLSLSLK